MWYGDSSQFVWWRVAAQIGLVQLGFWMLMGCSLLVLDVVLNVSPQDVLWQMFDWQCCFNLDSVRGYASIIAGMLTAVASSGVLLVVVGRAKKCLDFCSTMYMFHFIGVCTVSQSFPLSAVWWVFAFIGLIVSTVCSELVCLRREMQEIPVSQS